jgi:uncharacterized protein (TIGR02996 family)
MTDRDALLRAICENPEDDAPRLVFADWLDEHGDPRQAEFIRVQIELARGNLTQERSQALGVRQQELWRQLRKWRYVLGDWRRLYIDSFRRGFNTQWVGAPAEFLAVGPAYWRCGPVTHMQLNLDIGSVALPAEAEAVARCPLLACLQSVVLRGSQLTDEWVAAFLSSPHATGWRHLDMVGPRLTDMVCRALAASPVGSSRCSVRVESPGLTAAGLAILATTFGPVDVAQP